MAYDLHIKREEGISLRDWQATVNASGLACLSEDTVSATNPGTGEVISLAGGTGTASVLIDQQWIPVFFWRSGKVTFKAPKQTTRADAVMGVALELAKVLDAAIYGDEGEAYDGSS